jgi:hypothetical protein
MFHRLRNDNGFANGFISFAFDPDYAHNGKFYTIHLEDPELPESAMPDNTHFCGLNTSGYTLTQATSAPGPSVREAVGSLTRVAILPIASAARLELTTYLVSCPRNKRTK